MWKTRADGVLELIDTDTGAVLAIQKQKEIKKEIISKGGRPPGRPPANSPETHHWVIDGKGRKLWVPKGTNPDSLPRLIYPYCEVTSDFVLQKITEGMTLPSISKLEGMPPVAAFYKWMRDYPEFRTKMELARKARAEFYADQAIETARSADDDTVQADRLRVDTYKWAAEVNDRETYGKQTKVTGNTGPTVIFIDTGIKDSVDEAIDVTPEKQSG